jgi:aromatic ring hydroxylase
MKSRSRSQKRSLFDNLKKGEKKKYNVKLGYSNAEKAIQTIKNIQKYDLSIQHQLVNSMLNRAKYNKNQTEDMRDAIRIYKQWIKLNTN